MTVQLRACLARPLDGRGRWRTFALAAAVLLVAATALTAIRRSPAGSPVVEGGRPRAAVAPPSDATAEAPGTLRGGRVPVVQIGGE